MAKEVEVTTTVEVEEHEGLTMEELRDLANKNNRERREAERRNRNKEKGD